MKEISLVTVTWKTKELIDILIRSCEKFKPDDLKIKYIVVETTGDTSYKEHTESLADNVVFINAPELDNSPSNPKRPDRVGGTNANAMAFELGKKHVDTDYTFLCHSDTCVTSKEFFPTLFKKVEEGYRFVGTEFDAHPDRVQAIHISGCLIASSIFKDCSVTAEMPKIDVGDKLTLYCREHNINHIYFRNTYNDKSFTELIDGEYKDWGPDCGIDRCLDENNNVMFMHLGRGTAKKHKQYNRAGKKTHLNWTTFCEGLLK